MIVVRLTPGGNLDPDFNGDGNTDGRVTVSFGSSVNPNTMDMARDSAGRILVACLVNGKYALARLAPNGALDPTFGVGGRVVTNLTAGGSQAPVRIVLDAQGRIVLAGTAFSASHKEDFLVARFLPDGSADTTFGQGGRVLIGLHDSLGFNGAPRFFTETLSDLLVQPDGTVLAVGSTSLSNPAYKVLMRLHP